MFNKLINQTTESLNQGNTEAARQLLDQAWVHAKTKAQRKIAHDVGNMIQRAIFDQYLMAA